LILLVNSYRVLFFISFITPGFVGSTGGYSHLHRRCKCVLYYLFCVLLCLSQIPTCRSCSYVFNIVLFSILWSLVSCLLSLVLALGSWFLSFVYCAYRRFQLVGVVVTYLILFYFLFCGLLFLSLVLALGSWLFKSFVFCLLCLSQIPTCRSCGYVFKIVLFSILWSLVFCLLSWLLVLGSWLFKSFVYCAYRRFQLVGVVVTYLILFIFYFVVSCPDSWFLVLVFCLLSWLLVLGSWLFCLLSFVSCLGSWLFALVSPIYLPAWS